MTLELDEDTIISALLLFCIAWLIKQPGHWVIILLITLTAMILLLPAAGGVCAIALTGFSFFILNVSTETKLWDFAAMALVTVLAVIARAIEVRGFGEIYERKTRNWFLRGGLFTLAAIIALTFVDLYVANPVEPRARVDKPVAPEFAGKRVSVALSGGGYRAVLMHAGVLDGLRAYGVPITSMASVSGGSIAAAFYSRGSDPKQMVEILASGRINLTRDLLDFRNVAGLGFVLPGHWRLRAQSAILDRFFLAGKNPTATAIPVMYEATDLTTGSLIGVTDNGMLRQAMTSPASPPGLYSTLVATHRMQGGSWIGSKKGDWPVNSSLSEIVAVSGAFPGAFEPFSVGNMTLVDGGVSDNTGLTLLLDANYLLRYYNKIAWVPSLANWKSDLIISSNAGKAYTPSDNSQGPLSGLFRSVDTLYARTGPRPIYSDSECGSQYATRVVELNPVNFMKVPNTLLTSKNTHHGFLDLDEDTQKHSEMEQAFAREAERRFVIDIASKFAKLKNEDLRELLNALLATEELNPEDRNSIIASTPAPGISNEMENVEARKVREKRLIDWLSLYELPRDVKAFQGASTLSSNYVPLDAYSLYRLGWLMVALNIDSIRQELKSADAPSSSEPRCSLRAPGTNPDIKSAR